MLLKQQMCTNIDMGQSIFGFPVLRYQGYEDNSMKESSSHLYLSLDLKTINSVYIAEFIALN